MQPAWQPSGPASRSPWLPPPPPLPLNSLVHSSSRVWPVLAPGSASSAAACEDSTSSCRLETVRPDRLPCPSCCVGEPAFRLAAAMRASISSIAFASSSLSCLGAGGGWRGGWDRERREGWRKHAVGSKLAGSVSATASRLRQQRSQQQPAGAGISRQSVTWMSARRASTSTRGSSRCPSSSVLCASSCRYCRIASA